MPARPLLLTLALTIGCTRAGTDDTGGTPDAIASCPVDSPRFGSVSLSEVRLDYACQGVGGDGRPTLLMLHGFPEFWMGWAGVMDILAQDYRVIAPDQRGYNLSDKPQDINDYQLDHLVGDIAELVDHIGGPVVLVGHDWGGAVSWAVAAEHPELVERLVILNAPHMNVFSDLLQSDPAQADAFSYVNLFVQEGAEGLLTANDFAVLSGMFEGVLSDDELVAYKDAWGQDRAIEGGLNWYRANFADSLPIIDRQLVVDVPTLVLWGMEDTALLPTNLDGLPAYVDDLQIQEVAGATHWIAHEVPDVVAAAIEQFAD